LGALLLANRFTASQEQTINSGLHFAEFGSRRNEVVTAPSAIRCQAADESGLGRGRWEAESP